MKKFISLMLVISMIFTFAGCSGEKEEQPAVTEAVAYAAEGSLEATALWLKSEVPEPSYGSLGGEWVALGI